MIWYVSLFIRRVNWTVGYYFDTICCAYKAYSSLSQPQHNMSANTNRWKFLLAVAAVFFVLTSFASGNNYCISRVFSVRGRPMAISNRSCPFLVSAEPWKPGQPSEMELMNLDNKPLQTFLVSIQVNDSLIGHMVPADKNSVVTCGNTSVKQSDTTDKSSVTFLWYAPSDLPLSAEVIVRMSVGNGSDFWKDCDIYYLDRAEEAAKDAAEDAVAPVASTTSTAAPTKMATQRLAGPDRANDRTTTMRLSLPDTANQESTSTKQPTTSNTNVEHETMSSTECTQAGNRYSVVAGTDCKKFQQTVSTRHYEFDCPATTRFDVRKCVCSFMNDCNV